MLIRLSEAEWQDRLDQAAKSGTQLSPWHRQGMAKWLAWAFAEGTDVYVPRRRRFDQEHTQTEHLALHWKASGEVHAELPTWPSLPLGGRVTAATAKARKLEAVWELRTAAVMMVWAHGNLVDDPMLFSTMLICRILWHI